MTLVFARYAVSLPERTLATIDASVGPGQMLCVMGPSGSGKSSLLLGVAGFLAPPFRTAGEVRLDGEDLLALPSERRRLGLMFQDALLFPHLSVLENVLFAVPRRAVGGQRLSRAERRAAAMAELARVHLGALAARDPATLSGGQRSRAALARTLAGRPRALLLDEPYASLDRPLRADLRAVVTELAAADRLPTVLVTHDADDAAPGATVVRLEAH